jgi:hypothetical protein
VILISQGSSEHSICFAVPEAEAQRAERIVRRAFDAELREGQIQSIEIDRGCSILAVVGDGMAGAHGVAAQVFKALGSASVNVRAIAQGASERNISVVIDGRSSARALRAVHAGFYLSPHTVSIGLVGPGLVGAALLDQMAGQVERLRRDLNLDLRVRGIAGSKRMSLASGAIPLPGWRAEYEGGTDTVDLARFADHVHASHVPHAVIIDCSASAEVAERYADWLAAGIHVVTPNKKANSAQYGYFERLREARQSGSAHYLYEATVGQVCRSSRRCATCAKRATRSAESKESSPERSLTSSTPGMAASRFQRWFVRRRRWGTRSPTRGTICRVWMSRASSSFSAARWVSGSSLPTSRSKALFPQRLPDARSRSFSSGWGSLTAACWTG